MQHLIFTNFGVGMFDEVWLMYRFAIFKNTVMPSLLNQSEARFQWHIFIDRLLPGIFKGELGTLADADARITLHEVEDYSKISVAIDEIIGSSSVASGLITSRIDDDDCLHRDAIRLIQDAASASQPESEYAVIALNNGLEFLPSDDCARPVSYETLALGLSMADFSSGKKKRSVTQYAHHKILETLQKQNVKASFYPIKTSWPLYLYTKHPLSDSYFFGARARILADDSIFGFTESGLAETFGLTGENVLQLKQILADAPTGMPHKYLDKLGSIRQQIKNEYQLADAGGSTELLDTLLAKKRRFERVATRPNPSRAGNGKVRVAIIGSCVTRDLFEIETNSLSNFEIVFYSARSSISSYLSLPNTDPRLKIAGSGFEERRSQFDLEKSHWDNLERSRPDIILIDLVDERIGLIQHQGSVFSASGPMIKAFERANIDVEILRPWNEGVRKRRLWSVKYFLERVMSVSPNIIFHKAEWAETYLDKKREVAIFSGSEFDKLISLNNEILRECFAVADDSGVAIEFIGGKEMGLHAGGDHLWSFCPYHYDKRYYRSLARQLTARIL